MAKNPGREFATMTDEERRRFAMGPKGAEGDTPEELDLEEPRGDGQAEPESRKER
jgi:hypothetical protein